MLTRRPLMKSANRPYLIFSAALIILLTVMLVAAVLLAEELKGTVIDVDGKTIRVETEIVEGLTPVVGDTVEVIVSLGNGELEMPAGDWRTTKVNGAYVTAEATDNVHQPAERGMKAVVHLSRGRDFRSGPDVLVPGEAASSPRGKVTMMRGNVVTIILDRAANSKAVEPGDLLELLYTIDGDPFKVGTWKVAAVRDNGSVEAEPVEVISRPSIGFQAIFLPRDEKKVTPGPVHEPRGVTEKKVEEPKPDVPVQVDERRETDVDLSFTGLDKKTTCEIGKVLIAGDRIEMNAKKAAPELHCFFAVSDEILENFRVSVDLQVEGKNFLAGLVFGDMANSAADKLMAYLATITLQSGSGKWWKKSKSESWDAWLGASNLSNAKRSSKGWMENLWSTSTGGSRNPTPGTLEFVKDGMDCSLSWNGEKFFSWQENTINKGRIGIMFKPISDRRGTAIFKNISVKRLD